MLLLIYVYLFHWLDVLILKRRGWRIIVQPHLSLSLPPKYGYVLLNDKNPRQNPEKRFYLDVRANPWRSAIVHGTIAAPVWEVFAKLMEAFNDE